MEIFKIYQSYFREKKEKPALATLHLPVSSKQPIKLAPGEKWTDEQKIIIIDGWEKGKKIKVTLKKEGIPVKARVHKKISENQLAVLDKLELTNQRTLGNFLIFTVYYGDVVQKPESENHLIIPAGKYVLLVEDSSNPENKGSVELELIGQGPTEIPEISLIPEYEGG